jgi:hypothetical protein
MQSRDRGGRDFAAGWHHSYSAVLAGFFRSIQAAVSERQHFLVTYCPGVI